MDYSFVGLISTIVAYIIFLTWSFAPESLLHTYGITYYPSRYYAIALPAYIIVITILIGMFYMGINMFYTFDPSDKRNAMDNSTIEFPVHASRTANINNNSKNNGGSSKRNAALQPVPEIGDMDLSIVSALLVQSRMKSH